MARGWTLRDLAQKTGISPTTLHRYESWQRSPRMDDLYKIACALDVTICDLLPNVKPYR